MNSFTHTMSFGNIVRRLCVKVCIHEYYLPIRFMTRTAKHEIPANNIRDSVIFLLPIRLFNATTYTRAGISTRPEMNTFR